MADLSSLGLPRQLPLAHLVAATFHSEHSMVATSHREHSAVAISQSTRPVVATSVEAMAESESAPTWLPPSEDLYRTRSTRTDEVLGHVLSVGNMYNFVRKTGVHHVFLLEVRVLAEHSEVLKATPPEVEASSPWASPSLA